MYGFVFDIKKFAIHDGPGIRTTVFLKGCPLRCWWCHNPESIKQIPSNRSFEYETNGITKKYSVNELFGIIQKDLIFYDESGGGVTFSGGEPLIQTSFLIKILKICNSNSIATAIDTSGYAPTESFKKLLELTNLFLYDLKLMDDSEHEKYTGVSNNLIKKNLEYLNSHNANITVRVPLIPGITDTKRNLVELTNYVYKLKNVKKIVLLPYNKLAEDKYRRLNEKSKLGNLETQTSEKLEELLDFITSLHVKVELNG